MADEQEESKLGIANEEVRYKLIVSHRSLNTVYRCASMIPSSCLVLSRSRRCWHIFYFTRFHSSLACSRSMRMITNRMSLMH